MSTDDRELVAALHAIDIRLARIEERDAARADLETRLATLEKWRERMIGASMAIGGFSSLVTALVLWALTKMFP